VPRVPAGRLAEILRRALARRGVPAEHAAWVVDGLVEASLGGIDTHGVRLFPTYLAELDGGRSRAVPEFVWADAVGDAGGDKAARRLDAGGALGMVAGRHAAAEAVRLARRFGVGSVAVGNSNHFGPAACYTREMARQGCLGLAFTNSDALVAPFGGARPLFGTNPISLAAPGENGELFVADFATSQVSISRVKHYRAEGEPLPRGWAVTPEGQDAADLADLVEPPADLALLPLGGTSGHKGECLSMLVEILCCLLAGEPFDHELTHLYAPPYDQPRRVSHLFLAFDLASFGDPTHLQRRLSALLTLVRAQSGIGGDRVLAPGDPERETAAERSVAGIPLSDEEWARLVEIERETGAA
jgi:LDH2 family malate/lactate/ureidoglycolate dehydrogenase